ncbi:ABC transporter ATP-binding protein [Litchfieldella xinjiangensis]|uniref:ABC transporter ATP-binding protein n=1 Tax=Litchfieldella xinjiangensis TaxID=1166948 RepID=UPI0005BAD1B1|nr:ATP-binding cassette domain-containing protein [Halomonas xinjiangensis]
MLEAHDLQFTHAARPPLLSRLSLRIEAGEVVGLYGDSGSGKTTLGRLLAGELRPQAGQVTLDGNDLPKQGLHPVQRLSQAPEHAVNPRWRIGRILHEAWTPPDAMLEAFGIGRDWHSRFPHELSGGELQRVNVVRALAPGIRYLIADEISAMLDTLTQAELWRALLGETERRGLGLLIISHDTDLLARLAQRCYRLEDGSLTRSPVSLSSGTSSPA